MATTAAPAVEPRSRSLELLQRRRTFWINSVAALGFTAIVWMLPVTSLAPSDIRYFGNIMLAGISIMGLNIVFGFAGQPTLGPAATYCVGAYTAGLLTAKQGWPPVLSVLAGVGAALVVGALIGMPALRVGGFYLAMVTAIAAVSIPAFISLNDVKSYTGGEDGLVVPPMEVGGTTLTEDQMFRVILVATLVMALLAANITRSAWGRWFRTVAVSQVGTAALGVSVYRSKVYAFLLSAAFGGLAGGLYAHYQLVISPLEFGFDLSLVMFAAAVIGGLGTLWGPILGTAFYYLLQKYGLPEERVEPEWNQIVYGALLIVIMILIPLGLVDALRRIWRWILRLVPPARKALEARSLTHDIVLAAPDPERTHQLLPPLLTRAGGRQAHSVALEATGVTKNFGGVRALDGAGVTARSGEITALIGPNGSGKTTLLNVCSGFLRPDAGTVTLGGEVVTSAKAHARAAHGLARTFQQPIVFRSLNGAENVMAGYGLRRPTPGEAMFALPRSRRHEREAAEHAEALLDALGMGHLILKPAALATLAEARIIDLARALALDPIAILLDEPAAGLDHEEIAVLEAMVRAARQAGVGVLLVEHDVGFVIRLADHVVVLDRGRVIAGGLPEEIRNDENVRVAYFGEVMLETGR
jgi:ABC-type branched-subunit amino acid transport system ATPase component/ABC-type branched-subunit amino acid transport system permease subunit